MKVRKQKTQSTKQTLRQQIIANKLTLGSWIQMGIPASAEILADQGFDWLAIDSEHGLFDLEKIASLLSAMETRNVPGLVRLPGCDDIWIRLVLDAGAKGIIVPMVNSTEIAEKAVMWAKYPPLGRRGFGFSRANGYGHRFKEYAATANDEITVIAQIEHIDAVEQIDEILNVDGIDGTIIGPYDLSGSMGLTGETSHPEVLKKCDIVLKACQKHRKPAGIHVVSADPKAAIPFIRKGYRFVALGIDTLFIRNGSSSVLQEARRESSLR